MNDPFFSYQQSAVENNKHANQQMSGLSPHQIDLSLYPAPHPISPLGKHLGKLLPPSDQTIRFFTDLFN